MFKGQRFKSQQINQTNPFIQQKQQAVTTSFRLNIINSSRWPPKHRSKSARKLSFQRTNIKKYSLQPHNNPQENVEGQFKSKYKERKILEYSQNKRLEAKMLNSKIGFKLRIRQSKEKAQVTPIMRIIVIDWLMQLIHELSLSKQALHYSIYYLDQLLNKITIAKNQLQIYALCCFMIAQKLQSQRFLTPLNASQLLKNQISEKDFICLQQQIVRILDFKLHPFTLWVQMNILLRAFQSYFKHQLSQQWITYKHRILWMIQGIIMENNYFQKGIIRKEVCLSLLYLTIKDYDPNLTKYFLPFCNSLKGANKFKIQQMQAELKYVSVWLNRRCECVQKYNDEQYHAQLKVMAASSLYN